MEREVACIALHDIYLHENARSVVTMGIVWMDHATLLSIMHEAITSKFVQAFKWCITALQCIYLSGVKCLILTLNCHTYCALLHSRSLSSSAPTSSATTGSEWHTGITTPFMWRQMWLKLGQECPFDGRCGMGHAELEPLVMIILCVLGETWHLTRCIFMSTCMYSCFNNKNYTNNNRTAHHAHIDKQSANKLATTTTKRHESPS